VAETRATILIIDDDCEILTLLGDYLRGSGYLVIVSSNGSDGIRSAFDLLPAAILCDGSMPNISGADVLKAIRENKSTSGIPFVSMTGHPENKPSIHRPTAFLQKPFHLNEALRAVEEVIALSQ
jgi:CheY-like chemotaxis protein